MNLKILVTTFSVSFIAYSAFAAVSSSKLAEELTKVKEKVIQVENSILTQAKNKKEASDTVKKIQTLIKLQKQERELATSRSAELEKTILSLEERRLTLKERITVEKLSVKKGLKEFKKMDDSLPESPEALLSESLEQPRKKLLKNLVAVGIKEIEALRIDLEDADRLEAKIAEERAQLEANIHELAESESILELNKQLQIDLINRSHEERLAQLDQYKKLKNSEHQVSKMIKDFNVRVELQEVQRSERSANQALYVMNQAPFFKLKGSLSLPVEGALLNKFGKMKDPISKLTVFKKGIEIQAPKESHVRAVFNGTIAYTGELPNYGRMMIIDHGDHFYTLVAKLGELRKKMGDTVKTGDALGLSESSGTPVYFEIRARNIPVDPLQWISNSSKI